MSVAAILDQLERVKQTAPGRWLAKCPAHEDRSPSISIRELEDGRCLIHDFGGCETAEVLEALGMTLSDLFPARLAGNGPAGGFARSHSSIPARDLLDVLSAEISIVTTVGADMLANRTISEVDWQRLASAVARIQRAREHAYGQ